MANDARWLWTALTRAVSLENVVLMKGVDCWDKKKIVADINRRIDGYKEQDLNKGRDCNLDVNYVYDMLKNAKLRCYECHSSITETWSIDRKDNKLGHVKGNCRIMCLSCNKAKH